MNRLADETSPYLLQHAGNPVAWYPWSREALEAARVQGKPILLSIGYSACHWCHVMAHESFEDAETAALMNAHFINIKVDREERPDLDKIYQTAHQILTRRPGGWPLTMFLSPQDHVPFFAGTYFPRAARYGLPGFRDVLQGVATAYRERPADVHDHNAQLRAVLAQIQQHGTAARTDLHPGPLREAVNGYAASFDSRHGGFGGAPKFPHPGGLEYLLARPCAGRAGAQPDDRAAPMALATLESMARGGIYDHIGGGFCRYAVDERWMIPHFEKMLYDNGPLLALYAEAWRVTGKALFARTAHETAAWALREMTSAGGGFCSSIDADSDGHEGRFYVWNRIEVEQLLGADFAVFAPRFGLDGEPNFEGQWHLRICAGVADIAGAAGGDGDAVRARIDAARHRLFEHREKRNRPARDDKILGAWNALMIKGLAVAGRIFSRPDYVDAAERALDFLRAHLWHDDRLLATCKNDRAHLNAYLDDYAFLIDAILALLEARWRDGDIEWAIALADRLIAQFEDPQAGGFFFTSHDHETLIERVKPFGDDALPSGNGIAARVLGRLGHVLGETRYLDAMERTLRAAWGGIEAAPTGHAALLLALDEYLSPAPVVVLRGPREDLAVWQRSCYEATTVRCQSFAIPDDARTLPGVLSERRAAAGVVAYVCQGSTCLAPLTDRTRLVAVLRDGPARS